MDELRQGSRFELDENAEVATLFRQPGEEILAPVHDESLHGLGLILDASLDFKIGQTASIIFQSNTTEGVVRHIKLLEDGKCLVGFECR